jgi:hypothetical protein
VDGYDLERIYIAAYLTYYPVSGASEFSRRRWQRRGVLAEREDIQIEAFPFQEAMDMVAHGEIRDAKTILALQHLALLRAKKAHR